MPVFIVKGIDKYLNYSLWIAKTIEVDYRMLSCCIRPNAAYWRISLACPVQSQGYILSISDVQLYVGMCVTAV